MLESHLWWICLCIVLIYCNIFSFIGYVSDQPPPAGTGIQHSQYVPESETVPPIHSRVHGEYPSTTPLQHPGGSTAESQHNEEEPFSPPELIPNVRTGINTGDVIPDHMTSNAAVPLSHDRQVSIDSCSNLVIDEQGSTAGAGAGGGFPNPPTSPPSGYAPLPREEQLTTDFDSNMSRRSLPSDQQHGFTPFVLGASSIKDSSPSVPHIQINRASGDAEDISQSQQQQLLRETPDSDPLLTQACQKQSSEDKAAAPVNDGQTLSTQKASKQKRRNYNAYSSDDDDDVFLPNPPPKSQADRCTIAMETDEEKSTVVKELEQQLHDKDLAIMDDDEGALVIDEGVGAASDGGAIATETEGEITTTEEEVDVMNDSQNEEEDKTATLTPPAIKPGKYNTSDTQECEGFSFLSSA